ncbi:hypothetical protein AS592_07770 [Sulfurovum riftiae]|uniref:Uncharacterized protein n=2 Tax=Sulfurovum riftiae TaxID=1630136 RepID=A0A151CGN9_9BACT|nr:hypothetical protein AS592_07770 [Sulfurovum riftiae]
MNLEEKYPNIFEKLENKELELRHLLNVDENYEDYDSEEYEFDFEEYNFVIYIAEPIQNILGEKKMETLVDSLKDNEAFENFVISEEDLYGVKSALNEGDIVSLILSHIEEIV